MQVKTKSHFYREITLRVPSALLGLTSVFGIRKHPLISGPVSLTQLFMLKTECGSTREFAKQTGFREQMFNQ